jgi:predicted dehydrogenase
MVDESPGLEVDEHSVTVARYETGLSKFETCWGTFTDPWTNQPQPKCGFVIKGTEGTVSCYDCGTSVRVQTRDCPGGKEVPVDALEAPHRNPVEYVIHCIEKDLPIEGPLSLPVSRAGQQLVDAARRSAREKRTVPLAG